MKKSIFSLFFFFFLNIFGLQFQFNEENNDSQHSQTQTNEWYKNILKKQKFKKYFHFNSTTTNDLKKQKYIQKFEKFSYGLLMGYSSGICLKKVSISVCLSLFLFVSLCFY